MCSGVLKGEDTLYNPDTDTEEKLGKIYTMIGNKPVEVSELFAGDIGAIAKLSNTKTGDTLSAKGGDLYALFLQPVYLWHTPFPQRHHLRRRPLPFLSIRGNCGYNQCGRL